MKKKQIQFHRFLAASLLFTPMCFASVSKNTNKTKFQHVNEMQQMIDLCFKDVKENILSGNAQDKENLIAFVNSLEKNGSEIRSAATAGGDLEMRPLFVTAQGEFERVLAYYLSTGEIVQLIGMIHTPTPATPLCTEGEISKDLVDAELLVDKKRLYTVQTRPAILRDYLSKGGYLSVVYPKGGRDLRTSEQLGIFDKVKEAFPKGLIDSPLGISAIDHDMIGAVYIFKTKNGELGAFAIKAFQANSPEDQSEWGIWFGSLSHPEVNARVEAVREYVVKIGGPDLNEQLSKKA